MSEPERNEPVSAERPAGRGMTPETEAKKDRLFAQAAGLMAEQGYGQTSIRDVGRASGFSLAGMYHYFESKEDLLFQIQERTFTELLELQTEALRAGGDPETRLRRLIKNHLAFYTTHMNEMKVCTLELASVTGDAYQAIEQIRRRYYRLAAGVVAEVLGMDPVRGSLDTDVRHHTLLVFGMLNWIFMWFDEGRDAPVGGLGEKVAAMALGGLAGIRKTREAGLQA